MLMKKILLILALCFLLIIPIVMAKSTVAVFANSIDKPNAENLFGFLKNRGHNITYANSSNFDSYKETNFIVMLGGPDAPEGIGPIVRSLLTQEEQEHLREKTGNRKKYVRTNQWRKGQVIFILAGNNRHDTRKATEDYQTELGDEIKEEEEKQPNLATINIEGFNYSIDSSTGYNRLRWVSYTIVNDGNTTFKPTVDVLVLEKKTGNFVEIASSTDACTFNTTLEEFLPKSHWWDNVTQDVQLRPGLHRLVLKLRKEANADLISRDESEFII